MAKYGFLLGDRAKPTGVKRVVRATPAPRPNVVDDGCEFEIVWFPHRNALSLLPGEGRESTADVGSVRGAIVAQSRTHPFMLG